MKKIGVVATALVAAQLLSGCFLLREAGWSKDKVKAGDATTFKASLIGSGEEAAYFFILPRLEGDISVRRPVFDPKAVLGKRRKLVEDAQLGAIAVASGNGCDAALAQPRQGPSPPSRAYKTSKEIPAPENKFVDATFRAKVAESALKGPVFGVVYVGYWNDDGDGIPEDNDQDAINCSGFSTSGFLTR